jgi:hypothetical protein
MTHHTRRDFVRLACCSAATASLVAGLSKFGLVSALAQGTTDYKALVCIFLFGGNDAKQHDSADRLELQRLPDNPAKFGAAASVAIVTANRRAVQLRAASESAGFARTVSTIKSLWRD